jgi:hypothetical protein
MNECSSSAWGVLAPLNDFVVLSCGDHILDLFSYSHTESECQCHGSRLNNLDYAIRIALNTRAPAVNIFVSVC